MAHVHAPTAASRSRGRLTATLVVTAAFLLVEIAGAVFTGSLVLLAAAGHMLTDVGGLALFAIRIAVAPSEVLGGPMLAVAVVGFAANPACAWLLHADAAASLSPHHGALRP